MSYSRKSSNLKKSWEPLNLNPVTQKCEWPRISSWLVPEVRAALGVTEAITCIFFRTTEANPSLWLWLKLTLNSSSWNHLSCSIPLTVLVSPLDNQQALKAAENISQDLTNFHKVWTPGRLKKPSCDKSGFSSRALRWNDSVIIFPWGQRVRHQSRPQSCPLNLKKWVITFNSHLRPISSQHDPKPSNPWCLVILPYIVCNQHASGESGLSDH